MKRPNPWTVRIGNDEGADDIADPGSAFLVGNGYLGYRGTLEEDGADRRTATIIAGLYDRSGDKWREPVNAPNGLSLRLFVGGRLLDAREGSIAHEQVLDLRRAVHERSTVFALEGGERLSVRITRFASAVSPHLLCARCVIEASVNAAVEVHAAVATDVWDINGPHLRDIDIQRADALVTVKARTVERGETIGVSQAISPAPAGAPEGRGAGAETRWTVRLRAGAAAVFDLLVAVATSLDKADPVETSRESCRAAAAIGFSGLLREHEACWRSRWDRCDILLEGDEDAQHALRFNLYHLLSVAPWHSPLLSIPARGLSGQMYKGAIFWDTEIFILPFFLHAFPHVARNILMYRVHTLGGARRKAREYGYRGAFYAWESHEDGSDACTLFNVTDVLTGRLVRTYFRDKQLHISADVVYAIGRYHEVTGDDSFLLEGGAEVVFECARFLLSALYWSRERRRYELLDVTGPDEYHERVHNDAYTNWIAAHAMRVCGEVAELIERKHPAYATQLVATLGFAADLAAIREAAAGLYQPGPSPASLVIPQFDGYLGLEDAPLERVLERKRHPDEYLGGGAGVATTTQVIKQADVVLGVALLGNGFSPAVKAANWNYYEPRTEHGSSLSSCAYSLVAADTGHLAAAYDYFMKAARTDMDAGHRTFVGTLYIGGTHPAASGGAWMAAVLGLCGVSAEDGVVAVSPRLPADWRQVEIPLTVGGESIRLCIRHDGVTITAKPGTGLRFIVDGQETSTGD